ncbi:MAG: PadR family transcriptional regulator [Chloroflexi bacterium]|nr:PadR family transcriptional regulator [Chloroflexota bacterium]
MSLEHAILGFLNYKPFSGYDLKKVFDTSVQHFWPADQSQIYRTLARLAKREWVEVEVVQQEDRPNRKVYSITETGQAELRRWLTMPLPTHDERHASLIQVFFSGQLSDEDILATFEQEAKGLREMLKRYDQVPQRSADYAATINSPRETFFWMLTLEYGIKVAQTSLEWVESVIQRIENGQHPSN